MIFGQIVFALAAEAPTHEKISSTQVTTITHPPMVTQQTTPKTMNDTGKKTSQTWVRTSFIYAI